MANPVYDKEKEWIDDRAKHPDDLEMDQDQRDEESDYLDDKFNSPSAPDANYGAISPKSLNQAEQNPSKPDSKAATEGSETSLFKDTGSAPNKINMRMLTAAVTRRRVIGGGAVGGIVGLALMFFTIASGPLQFIHLAQLLRQFHFSANEDSGDGRLLKLYKWGKYAKEGTQENTRLSIAGRRIAAKMDPKLAEIGVTKKYSDTIGAVYQGTEIDREKFAENAKGGEQFKGLDPEEFKTKFKEVYGIDLTVQSDGTLLSSGDNGFLNYFRNRRLNTALVEEAGLSKIPGTIAARVMGQRDSVVWHPIKKADAAIVGKVDEVFSAWLKRQKDRINSGQDNNIEVTGDPAKDPKTGKPDPVKAGDNQRVASETDGVVRDVKAAEETAAGDTNLAIKGVLESKFGKGAIGGVALVGLVCAAKGISENADKLQHDMVVLPLIRTGMQAISLGNQVMSGQDVDLQQLGLFSKQLNDPQTGSWANARSIQAQLGQPQTGPDLPPEASVKKASEGSLFTDFIDSVPGVSTACDILDSAVGQVFSFAVSLTTPLFTLAQTAVTSTDAFKNMLAGVVKWLAGSPIPAYVTGATFGNYANYGAKLAANDAAATQGGAALTTTQTVELENFRNQDMAQQYAHKSFGERFLDPYSSDSFIAKVIDQQSPDLGHNIASIFGSILNPAKFIKLMRLPFSSKVSAATTYDYGFPTIGFSSEDLNSSEFDNPYANQDAAIALLAGPSGQQYMDKAKQCFGITLGSDGSLEHDYSFKLDVTSKDYPKDCGQDSPAGFKKIRFYILDTMTAAGADCYDSGDSDSCNLVGMNATDSSGETSTTNPPTTANSNIYILGDSLSVGMRDYGDLKNKLKSVGWTDITIEAYCGRHLHGTGDRCGSAPPAQFDGLAQVDQVADNNAIKNASTVVIELGTNDYKSSSFAADASQMIDKIKALNPGAKIMWVNLYSKDSRASSLQTMNNVLNNLSTSKGISIIDWASVAAPYYADSPDGLHPSKHWPEMASTVVFNIGAPITDTGTLVAGDTTNIPCAAGTDAGIADGYKDGLLTKIRLCNIGVYKVNSQVSKKFSDMVAAASAAGLSLTGPKSNGFRTMQDQIDTYHIWCARDHKTPTPPPYPNINAIRCPGSAAPGFSNHQMGFAADLGCNGSNIPMSYSDASHNPCWQWMLAHSQSYGFYEYGKGTSHARASSGYEGWHWSVDGG